MDFEYSDKTKSMLEKVTTFLEQHVFPNDETYHRQIVDSGDKHHHPAILEELKDKARAEGLWNLFLPDSTYGAGLTNLEYAPLAEAMGRSLWASEVFNCNAPDTGNMEIMAEFGSEAQKKEWLEPLLDGKIRSCFSMTEPATAGSDPTQLATRAVREGDEYVINGHKWFTSNASHPNCKIAIAMVVSDPEAPRHQRASMILVPFGTPGFTVVRPVAVFNDDGGHGHCEVRYEDCRVPVSNLLGEEGGGFTIAQARLGPGRIHHCMRGIGGAEQALKLMCERAQTRWTHGSLLAEKGLIQSWIAESRMAIDQARLLVLYAAWKMDTMGKRQARQEISMVKTVVANMFQTVCDHAIQLFGARGTTNEEPLAKLWAYARVMRIVDGPDEVHNMVVARRELGKYAQLAETAPKPR
ncbi:MAG: acyl-CoA dehydrogenase family protein [SAR324 cluster bacterium]|nr:acyl-CoA dehydrogenase family protein [SAR324 cluster bacterium]MCZ6533367.1 acyl-CoA dehydrogenase family protein [SAR324 cluster bacterium]MCZ6556841.1 acyl-CoA dehydrogenase family protein [SAR324 cluster bacterium]MCZ6644875.1 acyl-CoA dehydrogenase family protein [SAR324 cluster bacterium]MCZ6843334.1 acyl-CoA dehydrogenase family protein [SAR324 cluster bacterium]